MVGLFYFFVSFIAEVFSSALPDDQVFRPVDYISGLAI